MIKLTHQNMNARFNEISEHCCSVSIQPITNLDISSIAKKIQFNPSQTTDAIIFCEYDPFNNNNNSIRPPYTTLPEVVLHSGYDNIFIYTRQKGILCVQKQPNGIFTIFDGTLEDGSNFLAHQ